MSAAVVTLPTFARKMQTRKVAFKETRTIQVVISVVGLMVLKLIASAKGLARNGLAALTLGLKIAKKSVSSAPG